MGIAHEAVKAVGHAMRNVHAGSDKLVSRKIAGELAPQIEVTSSEFTAGSPLSVACTVDGIGTPPSLEWSAVPIGTQSILLVCEDPDAPFPEPFVHWIVYDIPASTSSIARASVAYKHGKNSKLEPKFTPAAPPPGHGPHHYHFQIFAVDTVLQDDTIGRGALIDRLKGHVLAWGELVATYERN